MEHLDLGVVLLNWNGQRDTIECLTSIYGQPALPRVVALVDNGSSDGSVESVAGWARSHPGFQEDPNWPARREQGSASFLEFDVRAPGAGSSAGGPGSAKLVVIENERNLGFSAGNNVGIRFLMNLDVEYIMLLNNDTVVGENGLSELVRGMEQNPGVQCMVPQIRYWDPPDRIWNCGGQWKWYGVPRYYYAERPAEEVPQRLFDVGFVTACALVVRRDCFADTGLLSERFFFGEEDVEFSWRMRRGGKRMACWPASVVYHKVSRSVSQLTRSSPVSKIYCHYLNRLVFLKVAWGEGLRWHIWRVLLLGWLARVLIVRVGYGVPETLRFLRDLNRDALARQAVDSDHFLWITREKFLTRPRP